MKPHVENPPTSMIHHLLCPCLALLACAPCFGYNTKQVPLQLHYDESAPLNYSGWHDHSLPLGNGALGASIFGGVATTRIQLNEKSLWSGGPSPSRPHYNGGNLVEKGKHGATMRRIQQLFREGKQREASQLCNQLTGQPDDKGTQGYGFYLSYGNMHLRFPQWEGKDVSDYSRSLNLHDAIAQVSFSIEGAHYTREHFISYPDNVLVTRLHAEGGEGMSGSLSLEPDDEKGAASAPAAPKAYTRDWTHDTSTEHIAIAGKLHDNELRFASHSCVSAEGGILRVEGTQIHFEEVDSLLIITSIATDYQNVYPHYRRGESTDQLAQRVKTTATAAMKKGYTKLKTRHVADYNSLFKRVTLRLGTSSSSPSPHSLSTDELLQACKKNRATAPQRRYLETLLFQYGRYLLISSSRPAPAHDSLRPELPANLQGIWAGANNSPWHADYHMNVNLQMNYWPAYSTQLLECARPLISYINSLRAPGRVTASIYAGITSDAQSPERGFTAHTQNNPFGWTCPGWSFDWGWSPAALPWILQNCWEHYEYSLDRDYMATQLYPMMRESALYFDQSLARDAEGSLVSSPSYSPEHGPRTAGNTYEHSLIWQLYTDCITAARLLNRDPELIRQWTANRADLKGPLAIGKAGQLKEWYEEDSNESNAPPKTLGEGYTHRHLSHLLGLYPGDLITRDSPEHLHAAEVALRARTDESTGWAMGQRINSWARLGRGKKAHELISNMIRIGILPNLWASHPPFQIDGNFGLCAGISEMLLQSHREGILQLLPALPPAWAEGSISSLMARGCIEVSLAWSDGKLTRATLRPHRTGSLQLEYPQYPSSKLPQLTDSNGTPITYALTEVDGMTCLRFEIDVGMCYTFTINHYSKK